MTEQPWNFKRWTIVQTNTLRDMWNDAVPVADIAESLGMATMQVLAKAESMGLFKPDSRVSLSTLRRKRGEPMPLLQADGSATTLANARKDQCRWMEGPPHMDTPICGHKVAVKSWCAAHKKRVFVRAGW